MRTVTELIETHGFDIDPHLARDAMVPVSRGLQRQGDVIVIPTTVSLSPDLAVDVVPPAGIPVVRGEAGGNTHLLLADGPVRFCVSPSALRLGILIVEEGATAYLHHPEHGYAGIGSGTYALGRQREQADEIRMVCD